MSVYSFLANARPSIRGVNHISVQMGEHLPIINHGKGIPQVERLTGCGKYARCGWHAAETLPADQRSPFLSRIICSRSIKLSLVSCQSDLSLR